MSNPIHPVGQVVSLSRPPQYWLRRAKQHRRQGEHYRAVALLRHAVGIDPTSGALRMEYAQSLRDIRCFEASTREAFGVLTIEPSGFAPYQIIGQNMISLGRRQEAIDAFSHYLEQARALSNSTYLQEEEDDFFAIEELWSAEPHRGEARLDALCHIGAARLARGALEKAKAALAKAEMINPRDKRLLFLKAMLFEAQGQLKEALTQAREAAEKNPGHVPSLCALASIYHHLQKPGQAATALMKAAFACAFPHDEQLFCLTASALNLPEISLSMLHLARQRHPDRIPTLFNSAIVLFQAGKHDQALPYLHRCLELDPEDWYAQALFRQAQAWIDPSTSQEHPIHQIADFSFYPSLSGDAIRKRLTDLGSTLEEGVDAFVHRLLTDREFYHGYLCTLFLPGAPLSRLISHVASVMHSQDPAAAQRMLRDILVQNNSEDAAKRYALSALISLGAEPPYVVWHNNRILQVAAPTDIQLPPSPLCRTLIRRIAQAAHRLKDSRLIPHALTLISRMDQHCRYALAIDHQQAWSHALLNHFLRYHGLAVPDELSGASHQTIRAEMLLSAFMPLP